MLRWPVNQVVDSYIKEIVISQQNGKDSTNNMINADEKEIANELGEEDSPFNRETCERCEKSKSKVVCYDCGGLGSALCEQCS